MAHTPFIASAGHEFFSVDSFTELPNRNDIKDYFSLSYRSIHRIYSDAIGLSPKEFLNMSRFRDSIPHLKCEMKHSQLAYENAYADQSHFIRSFKALSSSLSLENREYAEIICLQFDENIARIFRTFFNFSHSKK